MEEYKERAKTKANEFANKAEEKINKLSVAMDRKLESSGFYQKIDSFLNRGQN